MCIKKIIVVVVVIIVTIIFIPFPVSEYDILQHE